MSFIAFSTAAPQIGEEQPLSSTAKLVSSWTTLDISATFPPAKTPYSVSALIVLGADLPSSGLLGRMRVRKFGDTTSYEEAPGALGITSIVYRDDGEYQSGGYAAIITIPVDTDGKFEYQLQNDSAAPRTMIRILDVTTVEEIQDSVPLTEKGAANGVATLNGSTLVVEDPANATATPAADKIPKADGAGKLDSWVTIPSVPPAFKMIEAFTEGVSHTGDTLETTLRTITIPANEMGAHGVARIIAHFLADGGGAGNRFFRVYFGGIKILNYGPVANATVMLDAPEFHVWNRGATDDQETRALNASYTHARVGDARTIMAIDTTADVDVTFTVQNSGGAGLSSRLRLAYVEVLHQD